MDSPRWIFGKTVKTVETFTTYEQLNFRRLLTFGELKFGSLRK